MNSAILSIFLVAMAVIIEGRILTREERRKKILKKDLGELIFKGNFVHQLYELKNQSAEPFNNASIKYINKKYIYKDGADRICQMTPDATDPKKVLDVVAGINCPFNVGQKLKFNETGFTIPAPPGQTGRFFDRNFGIRRVRRYCSGQNFKLLHCQKEDFQRVMLLNARLTWTKDVWYNYHQFLHKHLCVCALLAKYDYFPYFTVSFYGQCQGVERKGSPTQEGCVNGGYKTCMVGQHDECAGKEYYDAIYEVNYDDYDFFDEAQSNKIHSDEVHSDEVHSDEVQSDEVHSDEVQSDEVHSDEVHSDEVRSDADKNVAIIKKEVDDLWQDFQKLSKDYQYHDKTP